MSQTATPQPVAQEDALALGQRSYAHLLEERQSVILGTVNRDGTPEASYAPCLIDEERNFYVYLSALSAHSANLKRQPQASVLLMEDETQAEEIFARKRATLACSAEIIVRDTPEFDAQMDAMEAKFGFVAKHIRGMTDFSLFKLKPTSGNLVVGFGAAFKITGEGMGQLTHRYGRHQEKK